MQAQAVSRCARCAMPDTYPEVTFDDEGVCNFCRFYDAHWAEWMASPELQRESDTALRRIFAKAQRKKKPYDALIGISGGKDSSYMLYLLREVYGLNVLTFTKDGGFLAEDAKRRIDRLVKIFDVPHIYVYDPLAAELSGVFMKRTGNFCAPCELSTFNLSEMMAREYDVPLLVIGSSSRTEAAPPKYLNPWDPWYFHNVLKDLRYHERLRASCYGRNYLILEAIEHVLGRRRLVVLPNYIPWDEDEIRALFEREYGIVFGSEHSDCFASSVAHGLYRHKLGGNDPEVAKIALFVRTGKLTRDEALQKMEALSDAESEADLAHFLDMTGLTRGEFDEARDKTPTPYLTGIPRMFNEVRKRVRRQLA